MTNKFLSFLLPAVLFAGCVRTGDSPVDHADPYIGTRVWQGGVAVAGHEEPSGYTFPGVTLPFGMTEWTAHTLESKAPGTMHNRVPYWYGHGYISGLLGTHYPSGAVMFDYGAVELMPVAGGLRYKPEDRASAYSHDSETVRPDLYRVRLDDYGIEAEMAATHSCAVMNFTFPKSDESYVIVDAMPSVYTAGVPASVRIDPERREVYGVSAVSARGYRESGYFVIRFDKDFEDFGTFNMNLTYPEVIEEKYLYTTFEGRRVNGLTGHYHQNSKSYGELSTVKVDPVIDFDWDWYKPADDFDFNDYDVTWTGVLVPPVSGEYLLGLQADDGARLYIDGRLVIDDWAAHGFSYSPRQEAVWLEAGREYDIRVEYWQHEWSSKVKLSWIKPAMEAREEVLRGNRELQLSSKIGAFVQFRTSEGETVSAKVATSFISLDQARENLSKEIGRKGVREVSACAAKAWNRELSLIGLDGEVSDDDKKVFYTAMYHSLLLPRNITEQGRYRSPFDGKVHEGESFTDYSLWDTFRAQHPLLVLLKPDLAGRLVSGLLNAFDEGGWMPKWPNPGYTNCMMGTHGDAVIADAYVKGVRNFDACKAEQAMMKNAWQKGNYIAWGRLGIEEYNKYGYVPIDVHRESVARTMEFSYDDWCIARFLDAKGDSGAAREFYRRSGNFRNVLDPSTGLVRGRNADGSWADPYDYGISVWSGFNRQGVENYRKNYTLFAPHDVDAVKEFLGGDDSLAVFLEKLFEEDIYYVGDEFVMHAPYMYNACGKPWLTQQRVREILSKYYLPVPSGLPGNDDCGQLSAWYLFSVMGFYPMCPGSDLYEIGSPGISGCTINLPDGKKFRIRAEGFSGENVYVKGLYLNGRPWRKTQISHKDILAGGELLFVLSPEPCYDWFE